MGERYCILLFTPTHTSGLIEKLGCVIGKLKNRSVCMQSAFLLFCCCDEKSMHANLSPSSTSTTMVVGYCLNRLGETVFMAMSKPMLTEFGIHYRLESCEGQNHCWLSLEFIRDLAVIIKLHLQSVEILDFFTLSFGTGSLQLQNFSFEGLWFSEHCH